MERSGLCMTAAGGTEQRETRASQSAEIPLSSDIVNSGRCTRAIVCHGEIFALFFPLTPHDQQIELSEVCVGHVMCVCDVASKSSPFEETNKSSRYGLCPD